MSTLGFAIIGLAILGFGLVSGRFERGIVTPPMVFTALGVAVGGAGLGLIDFDIDRKIIHLLAELTLVIILFTDASRIDLRLLRREHDLPVRLLAVGLPLTVLAGALAAALLFKALSIWEAFVLAMILAPTDAALGQAVVSSPKVPVRVRQALNVESGLNDGIALPFLLIFLSLAGAAAGHGEGEARNALQWIAFTAKQVGLGPIVGVAVGYVGSTLLQRAFRAGWINHTFLELSAVGLALLAFGAAELVDGNGFIAAFAAGLIMGNVARDICESLYEFGEAEGQLLALLAFMVFGGLMLPEAMHQWTWPMLIYALLSLTVIRMVPVALCLIGARLKHATCYFLGWFGPRGIASILYGLLILEAFKIPGIDTVISTMVLTVLLSIVLHGVTANPLANLYARAIERMPDRDLAEMMEVEEMPVRLGGRRHRETAARDS